MFLGSCLKLTKALLKLFRPPESSGEAFQRFCAASKLLRKLYYSFSDLQKSSGKLFSSFWEAART
eukprot:16440210-Heterocapsa_arctica.AAC.1